MKNLIYLRTLLLSGLALGVEKFAEIAQGEHDPIRFAVAGGAVAFTTAAHFLVHRASEQHMEADRELHAQRNHLVCHAMLAALRRALTQVSMPSDPLNEKLAHCWDDALAAALSDNDLLERLFPAELFEESHWQLTNVYRTSYEEDAAALAAFLREWLTTDAHLFHRWSQDEALDFASRALPFYQRAFADDLVREGGALYQAFTIKGINEIRAFTLVALPLLKELAQEQRTGFAEIMKALRELQERQPPAVSHAPLTPIQPAGFREDDSVAALYCQRLTNPSYSCGRFQALLDFSYLLVCLDQLDSGAWGTSVGFWMKEVGRRTAGFRLERDMATEGGIETTAFCAHGLSAFLPMQDISGKQWAGKCRSYLRERQKDDGSFGYKRRTLRDFQRQIESTCRHTSQALIALMSLSESGADLLQPAFTLLFETLFEIGRGDPLALARRAPQKEKYPSMLISALVCAIGLMESKVPWLPAKLHGASAVQDLRICRNTLVESLAYLDRERYPFFEPYGRFEEMLWYSFLSVLSFLRGQDLQCIKNRVNDGIECLLDEVEEDESIRFWKGSSSPDYGLTILFFKVLSTTSIRDTLSASVRSRVEVVYSRMFQWLLEHFDKYRSAPSLFLYSSSGTIIQSAWLPRCRHIDCNGERLAALDALSGRLNERGSTGRDRITSRTDLLHDWFGKATVDCEALAQLLEDRVSDIDPLFS